MFLCKSQNKEISQGLLQAFEILTAKSVISTVIAQHRFVFFILFHFNSDLHIFAQVKLFVQVPYYLSTWIKIFLIMYSQHKISKLNPEMHRTTPVIHNPELTFLCSLKFSHWVEFILSEL